MAALLGRGFTKTQGHGGQIAEAASHDREQSCNQGGGNGGAGIGVPVGGDRAERWFGAAQVGQPAMVGISDGLTEVRHSTHRRGLVEISALQCLPACLDEAVV